LPKRDHVTKDTSDVQCDTKYKVKTKGFSFSDFTTSLAVAVPHKQIQLAYA